MKRASVGDIAEFSRRLFNNWRTPPDMDEPQQAVWLQNVATLFADYPPEVLEAVIHPRRGLPGKQTFFPSIAEVAAACEEHMGPLQARAKRDLDAIETELLLAEQDADPERRRRIADECLAMYRLTLTGALDLPPPERPEVVLARTSGLSEEDVQAKLDAIPDAPMTPAREAWLKRPIEEPTTEATRKRVAREIAQSTAAHVARINEARGIKDQLPISPALRRYLNDRMGANLDMGSGNGPVDYEHHPENLTKKRVDLSKAPASEWHDTPRRPGWDSRFTRADGTPLKSKEPRS